MLKKIKNKIKLRSLNVSRGDETAYDQPVISWQASEYIQHKKGWLWYMIFAIIFIGGAVLAYLYNSWTFSVALVTFAVVYLIFDRPHPKNIKVILSNIGIKVGNKVYQYNRIKAFWIVYNPPFHKSLNIKVYNEFLEEIEIQLGNEDPNRIYEFLSKKLPELEGKEPGLLDNLSKILKH